MAKHQGCTSLTLQEAVLEACLKHQSISINAILSRSIHAICEHEGRTSLTPNEAVLEACVKLRVRGWKQQHLQVVHVCKAHGPAFNM
eukprot:972388-Pelagomonas_calceolata.AAC.1